MKIGADRFPSPVGTVQAGALSEKVLECSTAILYHPGVRTHPSISGVEDHLSTRESPPAVESKLPLRALLQMHLGPVVRQMIVGARHSHCEQVAGVQRKEIHPRRSGVLVAYISAHVEVGKAAHSGDRRHSAHLDSIEPERHDAQPGRPLIRVHLKPIGQ